MLLLLILATATRQVYASGGRIGVAKNSDTSSTVAMPPTTQVIVLSVPIWWWLSLLERRNLLELLIVLLLRYTLLWWGWCKLLLWWRLECWLSGSIISCGSHSIHVMEHVGELINLRLNGLHVCSHIRAHLLIRFRQGRKSFGVCSKCCTKIANKFFVGCFVGSLIICASSLLRIISVAYGGCCGLCLFFKIIRLLPPLLEISPNLVRYIESAPVLIFYSKRVGAEEYNFTYLNKILIAIWMLGKD